MLEVAALITLGLFAGATAAALGLGGGVLALRERGGRRVARVAREAPEHDEQHQREQDDPDRDTDRTRPDE